MHTHANARARAHTHTSTRMASSRLSLMLSLPHAAHTAVMCRMATWSTFVALHSAAFPRDATSPELPVPLEISSSALPRAGASGGRRAQEEGGLGTLQARRYPCWCCAMCVRILFLCIQPLYHSYMHACTHSQNATAHQFKHTHTQTHTRDRPARSLSPSRQSRVRSPGWNNNFSRASPRQTSPPSNRRETPPDTDRQSRMHGSSAEPARVRRESGGGDGRSGCGREVAEGNVETLVMLTSSAFEGWLQGLSRLSLSCLSSCLSVSLA